MSFKTMNRVLSGDPEAIAKAALAEFESGNKAEGAALTELFFSLETVKHAVINGGVFKRRVEILAGDLAEEYMWQVNRTLVSGRVFKFGRRKAA